MNKKVNFYVVDLFKSLTKEKCDYKEIKQHLIDIISKESDKKEEFCILDLSEDNVLHHQIADIFVYENSDYLLMRVSNQKPSGSYLQRNYSTKIPDAILKEKNEKENGIELYTYLYFNYSTAILAIVNQQGAPSQKIMDNFFKKYNSDYCLQFTAIPNANGIEQIYQAKGSKISQIEIEVPVPSAEALQQWFGWDARDILLIQNGKLKATMKLSGIDRQKITSNDEETRGLIDCIKSKIGSYNKAKIRAKAGDKKVKDYNFFDENFTYNIDIMSYKVVAGEKQYLTAIDLIDVYKDNLIMAYNENINTLKQISNR